ncbi:hypothetical protein AURDEDRAFT_111746 [Auricularia subglabra TFB-10046 SS5]|nr:hypothetical protein AURDEDRAFT_111746 [Auricularia subglabra TFB-10046 SS5]
MRLLCALLATASAALAAQVPIGVTNAAVTLAPATDSSWTIIPSPGAFNSSGAFNINNTNVGTITIKAPIPVGFEYWAYQRSDGGVLQITFDGAQASRIDLYNKTSTGDDFPLKLFTVSGLENTAHTVVVSNLNDSRVAHFGQANMDHAVLITADPPVSTTDPDTDDGTPTGTVPQESETSPAEANLPPNAAPAGLSPAPVLLPVLLMTAAVRLFI